MAKISLSVKILFCLVLVAAITFSFFAYAASGQSIISFIKEEPISYLFLCFIIIFLIFGSGFLGIKLSSKIHFPEIWDAKLTIKQKVVFPIICGLALSVIIVLIRLLLIKLFTIEISQTTDISDIILFISDAFAAILDEIFFRLFLISFIIWLFSNKIFKSRYSNVIFWIAAIVIPIVYYYYFNTGMFYRWFDSRDIGYLAQFINGTFIYILVHIVCAYSFKKYGIISAIIIHYVSLIGWRIIENIIY